MVNIGTFHPKLASAHLTVYEKTTFRDGRMNDDG